eukprot:1054312-Pyramimonas_sp.AAC.2
MNLIVESCSSAPTASRTARVGGVCRPVPRGARSHSQILVESSPSRMTGARLAGRSVRRLVSWPGCTLSPSVIGARYGYILFPFL